VDSKQGGQLLGRCAPCETTLAQQLGFLVPSIHITDNLTLKEREYVIYLRGVEIARWEMRRDCLLAISSQSSPPALPGQDTREPAFNAPAKWITPELQPQAVAAGYVVVDHTSALATHLSEVVKQNAHLLLTRQETKRLDRPMGDSHPKLSGRLLPKLMTLGEVQKVLPAIAARAGLDSRFGNDSGNHGRNRGSEQESGAPGRGSSADAGACAGSAPTG
jgi:flagellar biosynthesis protein FlhA